MSKRNFFSLAEKVKIINYAEENPHLSSRKLAEEFGCGRPCIQTLIKQKEDILTDWKCCENSSLKKKGRSEQFQDINNAVWLWFCMAKEALIPVSGPMIQEEALQIALKLNVTGFTASNGWLEKWKTRHNVKQFSVAGEDIERPELKIRSSQAALSIADDLNNFCETLGDAELVSALSLVTRRIEILRLKNVSQKKVTDYFNKTLEPDCKLHEHSNPC